MNAPSIKTLMRIRGMTPQTAARLRFYIHGGPMPVTSLTDGWPRSDRILQACNDDIDAHGVEYVWDQRLGDPNGCWGHPRLAYVNQGETYATTLMYDYLTGTYRVGCWGDVAARLGEHLL